MQYEIHTSATITDRIQPSYNLRQTRLKKFSPLPPPLPPNKFQGWGNGAFWLLRGFILGVEWGFVVPFYSVQDCCQHYFEVGL